MGTHHTKGLLFFTPRGVRLCIHTANYIPGDLLLKTQGVWMQDFPRKQEAQLASSASNSFTSAAAAAAGAAAPSDFETALVNYFSHCCRGHEDQCGDPRTLLSAFDFRNARGALVGSVPGYEAPRFLFAAWVLLLPRHVDQQLCLLTGWCNVCWPPDCAPVLSGVSLDTTAFALCCREKLLMKRKRSHQTVPSAQQTEKIGQSCVNTRPAEA